MKHICLHKHCTETTKVYNHWARWVQYNILQYIEYNNMYQKTVPTGTSKRDMNLYKKNQQSLTKYVLHFQIV